MIATTDTERPELRKARRLAGLSQTDLAKRLRVSLSAVSAWESGIRCPSDTLIPSLASALGMAPDRLLVLVGKN